MDNTNILNALQKLKVDCLYKKSTHFNAARRVQKGSNIFYGALIAGTVFASVSTIMNIGIWEKIPGDNIIWQVLINILGALGGFLILYTTAFSDYKTKIEVANKHEVIANDLNLIFKRIRNTEAAFKDNMISEGELAVRLNSFTDEYIAKCDNAPITKDEDFNKARKNFKKGFTAEYTEEELNC